MGSPALEAYFGALVCVSATVFSLVLSWQAVDDLLTLSHAYAPTEGAPTPGPVNEHATAAGLLVVAQLAMAAVAFSAGRPAARARPLRAEVGGDKLVSQLLDQVVRLCWFALLAGFALCGWAAVRAAAAYVGDKGGAEAASSARAAAADVAAASSDL